MIKNGRPHLPPGANSQKNFQKTLDKSLQICYNIYTVKKSEVKKYVY